MTELVLHQFESSPFCDKVRRLLHYKRRAYRTHEVPPTETLVRLRRLNPAGKVPVLEHGEAVVSDSTEIARYLEVTFPDPPIYPRDPKARALCHILEDWADESLYFYEAWFRFGLSENAGEFSRRSSQSEPPLLRRATERALPTLMRNVLRLQGIGRKPPERVLADFDRHLDALEGWLGGGDWLVTDHLTVADVAVYAQVSCAAETAEAQGVVADHPRALAWMERVNAATSPPV
ncbi:MAG: glutathione S-transferase family protein [Myxococcota bacterium]|nr:glutathione S-transferase family protein [Myxococcota bacterium]